MKKSQKKAMDWTPDNGIPFTARCVPSQTGQC